MKRRQTLRGHMRGCAGGKASLGPIRLEGFTEEARTKDHEHGGERRGPSVHRGGSEKHLTQRKLLE